jgi:hypothetical protein
LGKDSLIPARANVLVNLDYLALHAPEGVAEIVLERLSPDDRLCRIERIYSNFIVKIIEEPDITVSICL